MEREGYNRLFNTEPRLSGNMMLNLRGGASEVRSFPNAGWRWIFWKPSPQTFGHLNLACQSHRVAEARFPVLPTVILVKSAWAPRTRSCCSLQVRGSPLSSLTRARPVVSRPPHLA